MNKQYSWKLKYLNEKNRNYIECKENVEAKKQKKQIINILIFLIQN